MKKYWCLLFSIMLLGASLSYHVLVANAADDIEENGNVGNSAKAAYATEIPVIDGKIDSIWDTTEYMYTDEEWTKGTAYGYAKILWTEDMLYVLARVEDPTLALASEDSVGNGVRFYFSTDLQTEEGYDAEKDWKFFVNADGNTDAMGYIYETADWAVKKEDRYYTVELAVPVTIDDYRYTAGSYIGFNIGVYDDADGNDICNYYCSWQKYNEENSYVENASALNRVMLEKATMSTKLIMMVIWGSVLAVLAVAASGYIILCKREKSRK